MSASAKKTLLLGLAIAAIWGSDFALKIQQRSGEANAVGSTWIAQDAASAVFWAFLTVFCVLVYRRLHSNAALPKLLALTSALAMLVVSARALFVVATNPWLTWYPGQPDVLEVWQTSLSYNFAFSMILAGASAALVIHERSMQKERRMSELSASLARARLDAIASRLNPHFLFNSLNSIAELIHLDSEAAERAVLSLSSLLRSTLREGGGDTASLGEELAVAEHYLQIESIRMGERLTYRIDAPPDTLNLAVPRMILLPLVENAVTHGAASRGSGVDVRAAVRREASTLSITVWNSRTDEPKRRPGNGIGLASISDRLSLLYGGSAGVTAGETGDGFTVLIHLPASVFHPDPHPGLTA